MSPKNQKTGWLSPEYLETVGLSREKLYVDAVFRDASHRGHEGRADINLLKGGIAFADAVTT
eukprot:249231-Chlamydomonas_euryale.AAC.1